MISLLNPYQRFLAWFVSGLVAVILLSLVTTVKQPATQSIVNNSSAASAQTVVARTDFAASHLEPNFYQYQ